MKKFPTIPVIVAVLSLIFIVVGIVIKQANEQPDKNKQPISGIIEPDSNTSALHDKKVVPDTLNDFMAAYEDDLVDFYTKKIYWDDFSNILINTYNVPSARKHRALSFFKENIFSDGKGYSITNFIDFVLQKRIEYDYTETGKYYSAAFISLRYKNLIPYMAQKLITAESNNNIILASRCISWFEYIDHPDMVKTFLLLDKIIPEDSPFRQGSDHTWYKYVPFVYRHDCLPVYLEVSNNPTKWDYTIWNQAAAMLAKFTNDTAVTGLRNAYTILTHSQNYWGSRKHDNITTYNFEKSFKTQQDRISGKINVLSEPHPLLDE